MAEPDDLNRLKEGADVWNAWRRRAVQVPDLSHADLKGLDLRDYDFYGTDLTHANLTGADLREARFVDAGLAHAKLTDARLDGADFEGADLHAAEGLEEAKAWGARNLPEMA